MALRYPGSVHAETPDGVRLGTVTVLDYVHGYEPYDARRSEDLATVLDLATSPAAWDRSQPLHLTGSALIVHPSTKRVLLRWHHRQQGWLQVGGHADPGETDPLAVALREGEEETGLTDLRPWPSESDGRVRFHDVVVVDVPASDREPAHRHADVRFLLATDRPDEARAENELAPVRWVNVDEALTMIGEDNVRDLVEVVGRLFG
jgi:8-oxo-dGTP pyrophosphatase MutT (NUDIX family)